MILWLNVGHENSFVVESSIGVITIEDLLVDIDLDHSLSPSKWDPQSM